MFAGPHGAPPQGSVWIVCDLRVSDEPAVTHFEQRVLAGAFHWGRFWTTPPLRPREAVFEMDEALYSAERDQVDAWVSQQPELGNARVVHPVSA